MSADTTGLDGIVERTDYDTHDGYLVDEVDRVNLSDMQLDDNDDWLYMPLQCSTESTIHDLYTWLKTEPQLDVQNNKKCIDTRTFTRPKKRSVRMSFESIFEGLPPSPTTNTLETQNVMRTENMEKVLPARMADKESIPPMLKSTKKGVNILSNDNFSVISGQESMEAFLNMSQSKGIDSFINLNEPEFNDPLMSISQPSILYASIISPTNESTFVENGTISVTNKTTTQNVEKEESSSSNINETFVMQNADDTFTLDKMYCTNTLNNSFKESVQLNKGLNETYDTETPIEAPKLQSNVNKAKITTLSSTFVTEPNADATFVQLSNEMNIKPLDTTYLPSAKDAERENLPVSIENDMYKPSVQQVDLNVTCDIPSAESAANILDISFKVPIHNQSTPMNPNMLNPISKLAMKHLEPRQPMYSALKAPTSLRQELLAEIQRGGERKWDSTYNHISSEDLNSRDTKENIRVVCNEDETDVLPLNRYQTYKKSVLTNQCRSQKEIAQRELSADQRKFYTFTKKSNNNPIEKTDAIANENAEMRLNVMDSTFCKPLPPKAQQKRNVPRMLSKLPKFLQKSNPNLVSSSLKAACGVSAGYASISSIGYIKGSQPDIVQRDIAERSQLSSNKLHPYDKLESGSEQRLLEQINANTNIQFPIKRVITAGSTESIESTQSAHSAPDLDDRLSTCSDSSSHNSCNRRTMNIEQLHQLVRMQEESLKQDSAPKPHIRVLENTWVETKTDLPSPILKNGLGYEINRHSQNIDLSMKCSSPLMSPTGSSHALNNDGNPEGHNNITKTKNEIAIVEKTESSNQVVPKIENKTRLRQPTNWSTGNKPAAVISGIPRPASRIPAPRFTRPNAKTAQADLRKGYT
ncbi:uncharacterized protein [Anoplolepis gracilipes]|uniref:uncharacterized protein n=1 Tax=Anoplolepis gracilipes TaxID=354296 RepID=UPI003BA0FE41